MKNWMKRAIALATVLAVVLVASAGAFAAVDSTSTLGKGYIKAKSDYTTNKTLKSYWDVFGAYAAIGTEMLKQNGYTYDATYNDTAQLGANALAVIMMGGDPYNYNGKNLMAGVIAKGTDGAFSVPIFNFLAQQAAGVNMSDTTEKAFIDYCRDEISTLDQGPDIGGWAIVALTPYLDDPAYGTEINTAITKYLNVVGKKMTSGTTGSGALTAGCVVTGLTALLYAGADPADYNVSGFTLEGFDVTSNEPWKTQAPLTLMYNTLTSGEAGVSSIYSSQYRMEFCDLYNYLDHNGTPAWLSCGVSASKLAVLKTKANALLAAKSSYTSISIEQLQAAFNAANALTPTQLNQKIPTWGETYYALFYAVNNCKEKGNPSAMTDLVSGQWYMQWVPGVIEEGLMNGTSGTAFAPNDNLTRAMMVQILYNMMGRPSYSAANHFSDVNDSQWYVPAVLWASENGITTGTSASTFEPDKAVTREQLATFICRFAPKIGITLPAPGGGAFADDGAIQDYAKDSVYSLVGAGIVSGVGNNSFAPKDTATRAQVAKMIYLLTQLKEG